VNFPRFSLEEKIGQLFMIGFSGHEIPTDCQKFICEKNIGFVILFSRNIKDIRQIISLTNHIHGLAKNAPAIFTDQEGGQIVRFGEIAATSISPMGITASGNIKNAAISGELIAHDMALLGIDGVFAPVLDVNSNYKNSVINIRSYSDHPETVVNFAKAFCLGLKKHNILNCGKHFPGHGGSQLDSHLTIPKIHYSMEYLNAYSLHPFKKLLPLLDSIMTAHVLYPQIDTKLATFSKFFIRQYLQTHLNFKNPVFSDCLEMAAIKNHFSTNTIINNVLACGIDILLASHSLEFQKELYEILLFKVKNGKIPEQQIDQSLEKIISLKQKANLINSRKILPEIFPVNLIRSQWETEKIISLQSITIVRKNNVYDLLNDKSSPLIIEFSENFYHHYIKDSFCDSFIAKTCRKYFSKSDYFPMSPKLEVDQSFLNKCKQSEFVIACVYCNHQDATIKQATIIRKIFKIQKNLIVVSLDSPYEIINFPFIPNYLVTFGSRRIQIEALFEILSKLEPAVGIIPVEIPGIIPKPKN
jgi:beta-N-acetylhexosaminidase